VPRDRPPVRIALTGILSCMTVLALSACSGGYDDGTAVSTGDPAACPTTVVDVVVSVSQWSDLVRTVGGDCVDVTTIVASGAIDPHDFEPGTADLAAFSAADLVVVNGAHYDEWATDAVAVQDSDPAVVSAAEVAGLTQDGGDPHLWSDPAIVQDMATAVTDALLDVTGDTSGYFAEQHKVWTAAAQEYLAAVAELRTTATGRTYVATEGVADRLAEAVGLTDVTPAGYRRSASNHSEPAPGDLAAFEAALADGSADLLIYNSQTSGSVPERLRKAAEDAGVPVVEVTESPEDASGSFVAWQDEQVQGLRDALSVHS
jgi:zinc/manganese transport system substrate-binding protein